MGECSSDIDWSRSVAEIDTELYKKYALDAAEIAFIESKVREMRVRQSVAGFIFFIPHTIIIVEVLLCRMKFWRKK